LPDLVAFSIVLVHDLPAGDLENPIDEGARV
jgi:hypothetical protein